MSAANKEICMPLRPIAAVVVLTGFLVALAAPPSWAGEVELFVQDSSLYLETDREAEKLLGAARRAARAGKWREALEAYQRVAEFEGSGGSQPLVPSRADRSVHVPVQEAAALELARLPGPALELYRQANDGPARQLFERALAAKDTALLAAVARRYLASSWADDALAALGAIAFERADHLSALAAWKQLIEACPEPSVPLASVRLRMWLCHKVLGRTRAAEAVARELRARHRTDTFRFAGEAVSVARFLSGPQPELLASALHSARLSLREPIDEWPTLGGDPTHARVARAPADVGEPLWQFAIPNPTVPESRRRERARRGLPIPFVLQPTFSRDRLFAANDAAVHALDVATGRPAWIYPDSPQPPLTAAPDETIHAVTCADGRVVARMADSVVAFDATRGRLLWRRVLAEAAEEPKKDEEGDDKAGRASKVVLLNTPPVVAGGRVVLGLTHLRDEARSSLVALDAANGGELWRTFVCSRSIPAFLGLGATGSPPAVAGDTVYHLSNLGALAALDLATGRIRWVKRYPSFHSHLRQVATQRHERWTINPPIVDSGYVFVAPQDAARLFAIDATGGGIVWSAPRDQGSYLVGVGRWRLFVAGAKVQALDKHTGKRLWSVDLPEPLAGRPALCQGRDDTQGHLFVPTTRALLRLNASDGSRTTSRLWQRGEQPGNLMPMPTMLVVAACDRLHAYESAAATHRRIEAQRNKQPDDPGASLALGAHHAHRGDHKVAIKHLLEALRRASAKKEADSIQRARRYLYRCYLALGEGGDVAALTKAISHAQEPRQAVGARLALARSHEREQRWAEAIAAYQAIIERHPNARARIGDSLTVSARALAVAELDRLIRQHGRQGYAAQESRAAKRMAAAKTGAELEDIARRFPNSAAAEQALLRRLAQPDAKALAPDLAALAHSLAPTPASEARALITAKLQGWRQAVLSARPALAPRWRVQTRIAHRRAEVFDIPGAPPGLIYFATARSSASRSLPFDALECRRLDSGQLVWQRELGEWSRLAVLSDGHLVVATFDELVALDPASGALRWAYSLAEEKPLKEGEVGRISPWPLRRLRERSRVVALAGSQRRVYAGLAAGKVVAFSLENGERLWSRQLDARALLAQGLFADRGNVWACLEQPAAIYRLDEETGGGEPIVTFKTREGFSRRITDRPAYDAENARLYVVVDDRSVHALDLRAGHAVWQTRTPFGISRLLVGDNGQRCYVLPDSYVEDGQILALDPATGAVRRRRSLRAGSLADVAVAPGALYMAEKGTDLNLVVRALDPQDLGERWRSAPLPLFRPSRLAAGDGFVALTGRLAGKTTAVVINSANGKIVGELKPKGADRASAAVVAGLLCLGTNRGIYAFAPIQRGLLDRRIATLSHRLEAGDRAALAPLANALYQRGEEERGMALLERALGDESLPSDEYALLKDQLNSLRESLAERAPAVLLTSHFAIPPSIDGAIDEPWRAGRAAYLNGPPFIDEIQGLPPAESRWRSPSDLSAVLYTGWDSRCFYFAIDVNDSIHRTYTSRTDTWIGDGLIISIDCENDGGYGYSFASRDVLLTLALTRKDERREDEDEDTPEGEYRVRRKDDNSGTVYEIGIPWDYLGIRDPRPGLRFGFNVTILDDDGDRTAKAISWTPGMILDRARSMMIRGFTPALFGDVLLTGPPERPRPLWPVVPRSRRDDPIQIRRVRPPKEK